MSVLPLFRKCRKQKSTGRPREGPGEPRAVSTWQRRGRRCRRSWPDAVTGTALCVGDQGGHRKGRMRSERSGQVKPWHVPPAPPHLSSERVLWGQLRVGGTGERRGPGRTWVFVGSWWYWDQHSKSERWESSWARQGRRWGCRAILLESRV